MNSMLIAVTIAKLATLGGVGIAITTAVRWFHSYDKSFKKGGNREYEHDFNDISKRVKSVR